MTVERNTPPDERPVEGSWVAAWHGVVALALAAGATEPMAVADAVMAKYSARVFTKKMAREVVEEVFRMARESADA